MYDIARVYTAAVLVLGSATVLFTIVLACVDKKPYTAHCVHMGQTR